MIKISWIKNWESSKDCPSFLHVYPPRTFVCSPAEESMNRSKEFGLISLQLKTFNNWSSEIVSSIVHYFECINQLTIDCPYLPRTISLNLQVHCYLEIRPSSCTSSKKMPIPIQDIIYVNNYFSFLNLSQVNFISNKNNVFLDLVFSEIHMELIFYSVKSIIIFFIIWVYLFY